MSESTEDRTVRDDASASFGPETEFESESSVSDKAFFQEEAVQPLGANAAGADDGSAKALDVEFGSELAAPPGSAAGGGDAANRIDAGGTIGVFGLLLAILSFFFLRSILGPAAVVVGFMAFVKGAKRYGVWSMGLGIISFVIFLATLPADVS